MINAPLIVLRREQLGISQAEAARRAGMKPSAWARIETGRRPNPRLATAQVIAQVLGLRLDQLLLPHPEGQPQNRPPRRRAVE